MSEDIAQSAFKNDTLSLHSVSDFAIKADKINGRAAQ
jgi:hypothetical protein